MPLFHGSAILTVTCKSVARLHFHSLFNLSLQSFSRYIETLPASWTWILLLYSETGSRQMSMSVSQSPHALVCQQEKSNNSLQTNLWLWCTTGSSYAKHFQNHFNVLHLFHLHLYFLSTSCFLPDAIDWKSIFEDPGRCKERGSSTSVNPAFHLCLVTLSQSRFGGKSNFGVPKTFSTISQYHIANLLYFRTTNLSLSIV